MTIKEKIFFKYFEQWIDAGGLDNYIKSDTDEDYKPIEKDIKESEENLRNKAYLINRYIEAFFGKANIDVNRNESDEVVSDLLFKILTEKND